MFTVQQHHSRPHILFYVCFIFQFLFFTVKTKNAFWRMNDAREPQINNLFLMKSSPEEFPSPNQIISENFFLYFFSCCWSFVRFHQVQTSRIACSSFIVFFFCYEVHNIQFFRKTKEHSKNESTNEKKKKKVY